MTHAHIEIIDKVDLAEHANYSGDTLGTISLEHVNIYDVDFICTDEDGLESPNTNRIAYVDSEYLGVGGFYTAEQGLSAVLSSIADCLANMEDDQFSEFIIPISKLDRIYLYVQIGESPSA